MRFPRVAAASSFGLVLAISLTAVLVSSYPAAAAPSLADVQARVSLLQSEAANAAEGAQSAKVQLASLTRTLSGIKQAAAAQSQTVAQLRKSLGAIAVEQYRTGGLSQSLELLFSSDPTLYLSAAGSLDAITRRKTSQLRKYAVAQQRLSATTYTVNDKMTLVKATQARLTAQMAQAQAKLKEAEKLLANLKKSDRARLARLALLKENADQASSLALAKSTKGISGRAGLALKFAIKQIGDRYVFGAAGMTYWDCSGLTMLAYRAAGVSLPHSAAAQANYGKRVSLNALKPGDLVFFGRPIGHVGIYFGGGKMLDAPHTGARVKVEPFGSYFGRERFVAARRF